MDNTRLQFLIDQYLTEAIQPAEREELFRLIHDPAHQELLEQLIDKQLLLQDFAIEPGENMQRETLRRMESILGAGDEIVNRPMHRVHFLRTAWFKYAAAIIILFGIGAYLWNNNKTPPKENTAVIIPSSSNILPGGQKAKLTLAGGRTIILDSAANGQIAVENGSEVIKRSGEIIYDAGGVSSEAVVYNTMSTPRGGQYQLTLSDGTKVWLNAASSITYPTVFTNNTREVKITGEVYFEVKTNKSKPFIVKSEKDEVTVLGTSFNMNSYTDEPASKVSLIDGAVKVNNQLLSPGQAYVNGKVIQTNIQQDVAWKNGVFDFNHLSVAAALKQIARWYDVDITFEEKTPDIILAGKLGRNLDFAEMMQMLKDQGVRYRMETGKKVIIF